MAGSVLPYTRPARTGGPACVVLPGPGRFASLLPPNAAVDLFGEAEVGARLNEQRPYRRVTPIRVGGVRLKRETQHRHVTVGRNAVRRQDLGYLRERVGAVVDVLRVPFGDAADARRAFPVGA
jgi:hypothetical protein